MRRYASTRCLSRSVERGSTQTDTRSSSVLGINQRRQIHALQRHSAHLLTGLEYGAAGSTLRQRTLGLNRPSTLGVPVCYSTAQPEPGQSPGVALDSSTVAENTLSSDEPSATREGSVNPPSSAESPPVSVENATQAPLADAAKKKRGPFTEQDYYGLGKMFLESPKEAFYKVFVKRRIAQVAVDARARRGTARCVVRCRFSSHPSANAAGFAGSKGKAEQRAFGRLISNLHERGYLQDLTDQALDKWSKRLMKLTLPLDDDVLLMMRQALLDLKPVFTPSIARKRTPVAKVPAANIIRSRNVKTISGRKIGLSHYRRYKLNQYLRDPKLAPVRDRVGRLPVSSMKQEILDRVRANTYTIVVAATGSGKSTQIPQIILNDAIMNAQAMHCNVICVQPRRIAAIALAQQVARERDEEVGEHVGYHIRHNFKPPREPGCITYYTTGIVLELLQHAPGYLDHISHIVLDEVHERDSILDLLMLLLKNYINGRLARGFHAPKLIITSATLDVDRFASYFQNKSHDGSFSPAPHISIPGRAFKVTRHYLDELLGSLLSSPQIAKSGMLDDDETAQYLKDENQYQSDQTEEMAAVEGQCPGEQSAETLPSPNTDQTEEMAAAEGQCPGEQSAETLTSPNTDQAEEMAAAEGQCPGEQSAETLPSPNTDQAEEMAAAEGQCPGGQSAETLPSPNTDQPEKRHIMPIKLICATICHLLTTTTDGAILAFLPGLMDILSVKTSLHRNPLGLDFSNKDKFQIVMLHSGLPQFHDEPFKTTSPDCRRIFLSTNIAETSITIPDVRYVIDSGKERQKNYYVEPRASELGYNWISKSCISQRAGRAGRIRDGEYFALFSENRYESFGITKSPEIIRSDLQDLCLHVKKAAPDVSIWNFLQHAVEPPEEKRVQQAVDCLQSMKALDEGEKLTALGNHLLRLPVPASLGKLVLLGIVFRCLDPLLIVASLGEDSDLFRIVFLDYERSLKARYRKRLAQGSASDHISNINIFKTLRHIYYTMGASSARQFAESKFINFHKFEVALRDSKHIRRSLAAGKFITNEQASDDYIESACQFGGPELNVNSKRTSLIKGLLLQANSINLAAPVGVDARDYCTGLNQSSCMSPQSINFLPHPRAMFVYDWKQPASTLGKSYLMNNTTHVTPLAACLFGGPFRVTGSTVHLNDWLDVSVQVESKKPDFTVSFAVKLLLELRKALDAALDIAVDSLDETRLRVENQVTPASESQRAVIEALAKTLALVPDWGGDPSLAKKKGPPLPISKPHDGWEV